MTRRLTVLRADTGRFIGCVDAEAMIDDPNAEAASACEILGLITALLAWRRGGIFR